MRELDLAALCELPQQAGERGRENALGKPGQLAQDLVHIPKAGDIGQRDDEASPPAHPSDKLLQLFTTRHAGFGWRQIPQDGLERRVGALFDEVRPQAWVVEGGLHQERAADDQVLEQRLAGLILAQRY